MTDWLYPANVKFYDVLAAFEEEQAVWPIHTKVNVGDTVYIYLAAPYKRIASSGIQIVTDVHASIMDFIVGGEH